MIFFYGFIVALIFFVIYVAGLNRSLQKENRAFAERNATLQGSDKRYKEWIKKLANMEPFEAYSEIQKADLNEREVE